MWFLGLGLRLLPGTVILFTRAGLNVSRCRGHTDGDAPRAGLHGSSPQH